MQRRRRADPQSIRPTRHGSPSKQKRNFVFSEKQFARFKEIFTQLCNPSSQNLAIFCIVFALAFDTVLSWLIVRFRPYTEIDWSTYMQQVECYVKGERNYSNIYGDTGPIVYPAGHLHIYRFLYAITDAGKNILKGQYIFMLIYLINQATVYFIFFKSHRIPPFLYFFVTLLGYRIHSIFMLRMFNDGIAMFFCYLAIAILIVIKDKSNNALIILSSLSFSMAVSIKMNVLLFAPVFYLTFLFRFGYCRCIVAGLSAAFFQVLLGSPFLLHNAPWDYIKNAFNFKRVFLYVWTVNWRMIPEWLFLDRRLHALLLGLHLITLAVFVAFFWIRIHKKSGNELLKIIQNPTVMKFNIHDILIGLFVSNFIGIAFSRSLHYQFYSWYYHTIPYILFSWRTKKEKTEVSMALIGAILRLSLMIVIEYCWNTYPSTVLSSTLLSISHAIMLGMAFCNA